MPRVLLRLAFDGSRFAGSQRQPGKRTVDGEVLRCLEQARLLADEPRLRAQGRTDAGVSALDHPIAVNVTGSPRDAGLAVAGGARGIVPWGGGVVEDGFDPRRAARSRTYHYHAPWDEGLDLGAVAAAWKRFEGQHDFSAFARVVEGRSPRREVLAVAVVRDGAFLRFEVTGRSFLWNQVRRMVGAALDAGRGRLAPEDVGAALSGGPLRWQTKAPAEGLVLERVDLPIEVEVLDEARAVGLARLAEERGRLAQRMALLERLDVGLGERGV